MAQTDKGCMDASGGAHALFKGKHIPLGEEKTSFCDLAVIDHALPGAGIQVRQSAAISRFVRCEDVLVEAVKRRGLAAGHGDS